MDNPNELKSLESKDRRNINAIMLAELGLFLMTKQATHTKLFSGSEMKAFRNKCERIRSEMISKYGEDINAFSYASIVFETLGRKLLETTDDRALTMALSFIEGLNTGEVFVVNEMQLADLTKDSSKDYSALFAALKTTNQKVILNGNNQILIYKAYNKRIVSNILPFEVKPALDCYSHEDAFVEECKRLNIEWVK